MSTESDPTADGPLKALGRRIHRSAVVVSLVVGMAGRLAGGALGGYVVARSDE